MSTFSLGVLHALECRHAYVTAPDLVEDARRGCFPMRELCARYGISPRVGYKWPARYDAFRLEGLRDQGRRPLHSPTQLAERDPALVTLLIAAGQQHPMWRPRKLLAYLERRHHRQHWPAPSTIGASLKREGLVSAGRRRRVLGHPGRPTTRMDRPNAVWTAHFKGQFKKGDGGYCYPLTVIDGYSRYLLACEELFHVSHAATQPVFQALFRTRGLPARIRTDNGVPFATRRAGTTTPADPIRHAFAIPSTRRISRSAT